MDIHICDDPEALARQAAYEIVRLANQAINKTGRFTVALAGGNTPRKLYETLTGDPYRNQVLWSNVEFFWGDERCVPPDHADSNYRMALEALLSQVSVDMGLVHRMWGEMQDAVEAAAAYEALIRDRFELSPGKWPRFDLILLGMGDDGHTASLFPGTAAIHETERMVVGHHVPKLGVDRITMTPPLLNGAYEVFFLVNGAAKAGVLKEVLEGPFQPDIYPSQIVQPQGRLVWLVDRAASARLDVTPPEEKR
ncbi:MAG: 6-phosphogluconolactonase [candidate division Zixibacteria bacterium]|nr:6-phosphogluconolactonase [candidate division Zixibacteria bacterium]